MKPSEIDDLRQHLAAYTTDADFIEKTIRRLTRPEPRKVEVLPRHPGNPAKPPVKTYEEIMEIASKGLLKAIEWCKAGINPQTSSRLVWISASGAGIPHWAGPRDAAPQEVLTAVKRDPCLKCGVRADIGCKHVRH